MVSMPRRYVLVLGTFLLSVLLYVDRACISAAKDTIADDLSLTERQMGWVLSAFALGYALCQTPAGWLADRWGPRSLLTAIVAIWSLFTGLTAAAFNFVTMVLTRLLFGAGEAGAFPGIARASYSWIPMQERGLVQGINFSGSRIGAACALPTVAAMIELIGWRLSFVVLMVVGLVWAVFWYAWFRNDPSEHSGIEEDELDFILATRQQPEQEAKSSSISASIVARSTNMWLICCQYFSSNFTFFFCLTWLLPHLKKTYSLELVEAGIYSSAPLLCGALGNWFSGWLVDQLYRKNRWVLSRRVPAIVGFAIAAIGIVGSVYAGSALSSMVWYSIAIFGADMTLAPSWSFCIDVGKKDSGVVSGTMNMAGNLGSFVTSLAFPYLAAWTASYTPFFFVAAGLNVAAIFAWLFVDPRRPLQGES
jgi:ACS family glucarate transporter-like MFS transporter